MAINPINTPKLSLVDFAQFKSQTLSSLFSADPEDSASTDLFGGMPSQASTLFEKYLGAAGIPGAASAIPSAADVNSPFSAPGQNVMTILNRVDVSFKAQFSELSELKNRIAQQDDAAEALAGIDVRTPDAEILAKVKTFLDTYNAGVNRFAPSVAQGGVLEGSAEANRARFSLMRDINNPLIGAGAGVRDGLSSLGLSVDAATGLASLDEGAFTAALAGNKGATVQTVVDFAKSFDATADSLNAADSPQERQLANLDKAIDWIEENRADIQKEFGPGEAAKPTAAFSKAAAAYYVLMAKQ